MVNMNMSLAGSLRGAQKESTVSQLLRRAKDDGEGSDKDHICLYMKLCNLILLSMILQLE
jgi:hypothetical protein